MTRKTGARREARFWLPFCLSIALFLVIVATVLFRAIQLCHGHFGYPMDDTYIHMAIAKNFAAHGVWGVTRYAFSSSTSSPLYTLLLASAYWISGIHDITPLALNLVAAILVIGFAGYMLQRARLGFGASLTTLAALVLLTPLPAVAEGGMEHVLHALLTLLFVHLAALALTGPIRRSPVPWLLALSPALVMTRYEGAFLVFIVSLLFAFKKRWKTSVGLIAGAGIALAAYGSISIEHGWLALPNSVLLKANLPDRPGLYARFHIVLNWFRAGIEAPHVAFLFLFALVLCYATFRQRKTIWTYPGLALLQFLAVCLMHLDLARTGWFYRYEAYLIALAIVACAIALHDLAPFRHSAVLRCSYVFAAIAVVLLGYKSVRSIVYAPLAFHNIYEQQYQTARFVNRFYPRDTIVLNDIGAVCFYTDARVLDVFGLGSMEPATAKMSRNYNTAWLRDWASGNGATLAILYSTGWPGEWFAIPSDWPRVATWTISDNFVLAGSSVDVFAVRPGSGAALSSSVRQFQKELPAEVVQSGPNVEKASLAPALAQR